MVLIAIQYLFLVMGIIIVYEILRAILVSSLKSRFTRSVKDFIEKNRIRLDNYKFMHKVVVRHELLNDTEIHEAIVIHAKEKNLGITQVEEQVEEYIDEIVPSFNLLSYYKLGYWVANFILNLIYEVVIDSENAKKLEKIPEGSVIVFVMNHRSNIDYILVAYMLARQISLSYAVGEWARVWPLEYIFKSFGAYFIRRRYRERLYHLVLEKYVQLISLMGVTQGIFLEGGLSRDGNMRQAKIGILDYILKVRTNPRFTGELVFVPAAISYDWILEDRSLIAEWKSGKEKSGFRSNMSSLVRLLVKSPFMLVINLARYLTGKLRQHGYASVSFGDPVFCSNFLREQDRDIFTLERFERLARVQTFADSLLETIGTATPVTPVYIVSNALISFKRARVNLDDLAVQVGQIRSRIKKAGGRIVLGKSFESTEEILSHLKEEEEEDSRKKDLFAFEEDFLASEETKETIRAALYILKRRKIVSVQGHDVLISAKNMDYLQFYANSLKHLLK